MNELFFFLLATGFMASHELDAVRCKEWEIFPGLALLESATGRVVFIGLHVPLFALLFWGIALTGSDPTSSFRFGFNLFCLVHLVAHLAFLAHRKNMFRGVLSWFLIGGAAVAASIDLWLAS